jgi:hypothetical protein
LDELDDPLTVSIVGGPTLGYNNTDTITISSPNFGDTSLSSPYTFTGVQGAGFSNTVWTTSSTGTNTPWMTQNPTGARISLTGEDADVEVNGWSLVSAVKRIEQRLGLFQPNPELEAEWADLQQLGEQYRKLEQHIRDKQATFDRIKAMPAPEID